MWGEGEVEVRCVTVCFSSFPSFISSFIPSFPPSLHRPLTPPSPSPTHCPHPSSITPPSSSLPPSLSSTLPSITPSLHHPSLPILHYPHSSLCLPLSPPSPLLLLLHHPLTPLSPSPTHCPLHHFFYESSSIYAKTQK